MTLEQTTEPKKLVRIHEAGVEIIDEDLFKKVSKGNLSASMVNSLSSCPADWILDKYILRELDHEEQPALERGTLFHEIMEAFFALQPGERTPKVLGELTQQVTKEKHPHLMNDAEAKAWIKTAIRNYLSMGFDFNSEVIPTLEVAGKEQYGLEIFTSGKIGNTDRKIVGFIDKIIEKDIDGEKKLFIEDWKTGKTAKSFNPDKPVGPNNSFDYWRQQALYAYLLEQEGLEIEGASLIFPVANKIIDVDFKRPDIREKVVADMEATDAKLTEYLDKNFFPFTPDIFCTWCHMYYKGRKKGRARYPKVNRRELNKLVEYAD